MKNIIFVFCLIFAVSYSVAQADTKRTTEEEKRWQERLKLHGCKDETLLQNPECFGKMHYETIAERCKLFVELYFAQEGISVNWTGGVASIGLPDFLVYNFVNRPDGKLFYAGGSNIDIGGYRFRFLCIFEPSPLKLVDGSIDPLL